MFLKLRKQLNKYAVLGALLHWLLSFFSDRLIFTYTLFDFSNTTAIIKTIMAWGSKIVFLFILIALWQFFYWFIKKADKAYVRYSLIYFGIMFCLLLLTWPGIWRMDEFGLLFEAQNIFPVFWQNYITSVFYIFSLMLLPFPAGIIIVQNACISLMVGSLLYKFENIAIWQKPLGKKIYFAYIPFLFFPVLDSNLYPMRMSLYAFLELYLLAELIFHAFQAKKAGRKTEQMSRTAFWKCIFISAIVVSWRAEAIYYLLLLPLCYLVLYLKEDVKIKVRFIIYLFVMSVILLIPQDIGEKLTSSNNYDLTSVLLPIVPLTEKVYSEAVLTSWMPMTYEEALNNKDRPISKFMIIDQVIDANKAVAAARVGKSGISLYWSDPDFVRNYSEEEYKQFKSVYISLIFKYPDVFLKERWETLLTTTDLLENTTEIFEQDNVPNYEKFRMLFLNKPISNSLRTKTISIIELRNGANYNQKLKVYDVIYHCAIPLMLSTLVLAALLLKRKWDYSLLLAAHLLKVPLIFLTAPSRLFMYYYPIYLVGVVLAGFLIMYFIWRKRNG